MRVSTAARKYTGVSSNPARLKVNNDSWWRMDSALLSLLTWNVTGARWLVRPKATVILRPGGKDALQIIFRSSIGSLGKRWNVLALRSWYAGSISAFVRPANPPKDQSCLTAAIVRLVWLVFTIPRSLLYDQRMSKCKRIEKTPTLLGVEGRSERLNSHRSRSLYSRVVGGSIILALLWARRYCDDDTAAKL